MGILSRLRRHLRPSSSSLITGAVADPGRTEVGLSRLPDGTVLERCVVASAEAVAAALAPGPRDRLVFLFCAADPEAAHDLHELRELHLYYSRQVDLSSIALDWPRGRAATLREAALRVDAFHRDHGLTWQSLVPTEALAEGTLPSAVVPQVYLLRPDGAVVFAREGAWKEGDRGTLERLLV